MLMFFAIHSLVHSQTPDPAPGSSKKAGVRPTSFKRRQGRKAAGRLSTQQRKKTPSSYVYFQNTVRERVKADNPGLAYNEIQKKIGEEWRALGEEDQKAYKDKASAAMETYKSETADSIAKGKEVGGSASTAMDPAGAATTQATLTAKPTKEKKRVGAASKKGGAATTAATASSSASTSTSTSAPAATAVAAPSRAPAKKKARKERAARSRSTAQPSLHRASPHFLEEHVQRVNCFVARG